MINLESIVACTVMAAAAAACEQHAHQCYWWFLGAAAHRQLYLHYICPSPPPSAETPSADLLRWN